MTFAPSNFPLHHSHPTLSDDIMGRINDAIHNAEMPRSSDMDANSIIQLASNRPWLIADDVTELADNVRWSYVRWDWKGTAYHLGKIRVSMGSSEVRIKYEVPDHGDEVKPSQFEIFHDRPELWNEVSAGLGNLVGQEALIVLECLGEEPGSPESPPAAPESAWEETACPGSSNVTSIAYNAEREQLIVNFHSGSYKYDRVSARFWEELQAAESKGSYLAKNLTPGRFEYEKLG